MPRRSFNLKDRTSRIEMTGVARRAMIQREVQTTVTLDGYTRYSKQIPHQSAREATPK